VAEQVTLLVNKQIFLGWKTASVRRGLQTFCGSFDLGVTDRFSAQSKAWAFSPGDSCEVLIGPDLVLTGFIDDVSPSTNATDRSIKLAGRDKTCDMVDCAAAAGGLGPWTNISLDGLARVMAKPYGVEVKNLAGNLTKFDQFALNSGGSESAFEALDRAAKQRSILLVSDASGALVLMKPNAGRLPTAIVEGQNFLGGSAVFSGRDRFSEYRIQGSAFGEIAADLTTGQLKVFATAKDSGVKRNRIMVLQGDGALDVTRAQARAQWEATIRAARATKCSVSVRGWRHGGGGLWVPNYEVHLSAPSIFMEADLLISDVTYSISDDGGEVTTMELVRKDAFLAEPIKPTEQDGWKNLIGKHKTP
jgi:prophage tail gpP-like protein